MTEFGIELFRGCRSQVAFEFLPHLPGTLIGSIAPLLLLCFPLHAPQRLRLRFRLAAFLKLQHRIEHVPF